MSTRLTKGLYGSEFHPASELFGLSCGRCCCEDFVHNGGWYNRSGEKLGWGDLSPQDFLRIATELEDDELFIILPEDASFWKFVTRPGLIGSMAQVKPDVNAPGIDYVAENATYIIAKRRFYLVTRYSRLPKDSTIMRQGIQFTVMTTAVKQFVTEHAIRYPNNLNGCESTR